MQDFPTHPLLPHKFPGNFHLGVALKDEWEVALPHCEAALHEPSGSHRHQESKTDQNVCTPVH